jgi:hypothetical protein
VHQRVADHDLAMLPRSRLSRLFASIASAGLVEEVYMAGMARPRLEHWLKQRFQSIGLKVRDPRPTAAMVLSFLATQGRSTELRFEARQWTHHPRLPRYLGEWNVGIVDDDPVGLLAELALPDILSPIYGTKPGETLFADHFLFSFLAAPQLAKGRSSVISDTALEIALFASACLNLPSVRRRLPSMAWGRCDHPDIGDLVAFESEKWLRANLPRKLFSNPAEALLSEPMQLAQVGE